MKSQIQIFYEEQRKIGAANQTLMELVQEGMTRKELVRNIERRPVLRSRFANWLQILLSAAASQQVPA